MDLPNNNNIKEKVFYYFMLLYFLFGTTLDMFSQKIYLEKEGIVMMEAENTTSPLDLWITSTTFSAFSGTGHLEFSGGVVTGSGSPLSPLVYKFKINEAGDYALNVRGRSRLLADEPQDWGNDAWFKVQGDYTVGTNGPPDISWMNTDTKIFVGRGGNGDWGWGTNYDRNHLQPKVTFNFKAGEIYTLTMSGRSQRFNVDRILLAKTSIPTYQARAVTVESQWFDDGGIAERYIYDAINHFTNINAGEVNYYKDAVRSALAIDASVVIDRDKFAKATTAFNGKNDTYNVTLTTLAEFDGECSYRFLVNDVVVGTFTNTAVNQENDYQEQEVIFEGVKIHKDDIIAVESNSHTNGIIPEGTGTAWARGRWKSVAMAPTVYQGRIAVVADGNYRDSDDIAGTPISLAILKALGLEDQLVHYSHSCDLVPGVNDPGGDFREAEMQTSCDGTAARFGGFDHIIFFNCQSQKAAAIADLKDKINDSSKTNPLWIIEAGEPDIIWEAVNAADASKREFIFVVTHHPANDVGDTYDLSDVMSLGIPTTNLKSIPDQNILLKKPLSDWYWARDHTDSRINWLWDRGFVAQTTAMNYPAIVGNFDCSDAGMIYYWATIKSGGDFSCDVPKLKELFLEYIPVIPSDAAFLNPKNGKIFETGSSIEVEAAPNIGASQIQSIELLINDVSVSILNEAPFTWGFNGQSNTQLENMAEGTYVLLLKTTNISANISTETITVYVKTPVVHEPYGGTPRNIPGIIQIEDYDEGGEGVAFHDTSDGNSGGAYRTQVGENVDIGIGGSGFVTESLSGGEFTRYSVNVEEDGVYKMLVNYFTYSSTSKPLEAYVLPIDLTSSTQLFFAPGGSSTAGVKKVVNENDEVVFGDYTSPNFNLTKGNWILEFRIPNGGAGPRYDYITLNKVETLGLNYLNNYQEELKIYPVPNNYGIFNLSTSQAWKVYSILGKQILKGEGNLVNISKFSKGVYILKIKNGIKKRLLYN